MVFFTPRILEQVNEKHIMNQSQITQIINLHEEGNSPLEIVEITGFELEEIEAILDSMEEDEQSEEDPELEPTHLSGIDKANELKERELNHLEKEAFIKTEKQKRKTLKEFKLLAEGLLDHCQGSKWDRESLKKSYDEIEELIETVEEIFGFDADEMEDNSIYEILQVLKEQFSGLANQDADYQVTIDWSPEKIEMLQYALDIENFDDAHWDREDFNLQRAHNVYSRFLESLAELDGKKVDSDDLESLQSDLVYTKETISSDLPGVEGEFEDELEVIERIEEYLKELGIRIDESFWGEKRIQLASSIVEVINELEETHEA